jgi:hypothetical protein
VEFSAHRPSPPNTYTYLREENLGLTRTSVERGWLYGMEMDSYKSRISDGVLVQTRNRTSRCLKLHASVSQFFGTKRTHSHVPELNGEALFLKLLSFFAVSADRRSVQIRI